MKSELKMHLYVCILNHRV